MRIETNHTKPVPCGKTPHIHDQPQPFPSSHCEEDENHLDIYLDKKNLDGQNRALPMIYCRF